MSQYFVPITDEMIYEHPEMIEGPLVPYSAGMECHEWLSIELNPEEDTGPDYQAGKSINATSSRPNLSLVHSAA